MICHYWFLNHGFKFQDSVCNGWHDLTMLSVNISDVAIITVKNVDYYCIIHNISKSEAINILEKAVLENRWYKKNILIFSLFKQIFLLFYIVHIKWLMLWTSISLLNISIGTVIKNPEMLNFVPDHLKTKKMCKHAVKKLP